MTPGSTRQETPPVHRALWSQLLWTGILGPSTLGIVLPLKPTAYGRLMVSVIPKVNGVFSSTSWFLCKQDPFTSSSSLDIAFIPKGRQFSPIKRIKSALFPAALLPCALPQFRSQIWALSRAPFLFPSLSLLSLSLSCTLSNRDILPKLWIFHCLELESVASAWKALHPFIRAHQLASSFRYKPVSSHMGFNPALQKLAQPSKGSYSKSCF